VLLLQYAGRIAITCISACLFIVLFCGSLIFHFLWDEHTHHPGRGEAVCLQTSAKAANSEPDREVSWPEFPGRMDMCVHKMDIHGVKVITQEWKTAVPTEDVIVYYRDRLAAQGWLDVTDEVHGLSPEPLGRRWEKEESRYVDYQDHYQRIVRSRLALRRGTWSFYVSTAPEAGKPGYSRVRVCAASTSSLSEFFRSLAASMVALPASGQAQGPIRSKERSAGQCYRTTLEVGRRNLDAAFDEARDRLLSDGWTVVFTLPARSASTERLGMFSRGVEYASLYVTPSADGQGSSLLLTEVAPE
jgi:hypothetical protein